MLDMREKLATCQDIAKEHAKQAQIKSKVWYDRRARERSFEVGQLVLVLLPIAGKPLETKYQGPFRIIGKLGPVDYVISTPNKRRSQRVCHVNMLKAYVERDAKFLCLNTEFSVSSDTGPTVSETQDTFSLDHLPERDRAQLKSLLLQLYNYMFWCCQVCAYHCAICYFVLAYLCICTCYILFFACAFRMRAITAFGRPFVCVKKHTVFFLKGRGLL